jgi:hypothetical protein
MARALSIVNRVAVAGDATAPSSCDCVYQVVDGDLGEDPKNHNEPAPDFNQQVDTMCAAVVTTIKTNEGI